MFEVTTSVKKMLAMTARKKVIQGATSSGKTYGIIPILYDKCLATPRLKVTIVAESIPAVKDGAVDIFKDFMYDEGRWNDACWIGNPMQYTLANHSKIQFKSFDTVGKAKSAGKRDVLFINEANSIPFDIADALMIRSKETWLDFNADQKFWAHTEVLTEPNSEFLKLTYLDNEAIPQETLEDLLIKRCKAYYNPLGNLKDESNIKSKYWANWWQVYGLGEIGALDGVILEDWQEINTVPNEARLIGYGMDFGFSNSYTAVVGVYEWNDTYILDEVFYKRGVYPYQIYEAIKDEVGRERIWADHARPDSIKELSDLGLRIKGAEKPRDATESFLDKMHRNTFFVSSRSENIKTELRNWVWAKDKTGESLNVPIKDFDHAMDATKYCLISQNRYSGRY